ncbi:hypothetical protein [uncultured Psychrosphaera sp.]|uniref:AbiU2 domain-containing protein n=1 Tax=uncultured Psychrosphaera sp. TaxID=1403522 RepID=UPI00260378C8|nr:hypothetical protein [uncultured Psychrosphaera sp.]
MSHHTEVVVKEFFKICDWLFQTYQMRKYLFDENPNVNKIRAPRHEHFFYRIQEVFQESWLHQLAKLHDPAVQGGNINLSLDYIIEFGGWNEEEKSKLCSCVKEMESISKSVKKARNKLLSHNDLKTITEGVGEYGSFKSGEDIFYFNSLNKFCEIVSQSVLNQPFVYDDLVQNDVDAFMTQFMRGET